MTWRVAPGGEVHLRSRKVGLFEVKASAPVVSGELQESDDEATLTLTLALEELRANKLLQGPARSLVKRHDGGRLVYRGSGEYVEGEPLTVYGKAMAGTILVDLVLTIIRTGELASISGSASLGTVELPLPGLGRIDDFSFEVHAQLQVTPA